jgi:LysM repeat protein
MSALTEHQAPPASRSRALRGYALEEELDRLRRRLWVERGLFAVVLAAIAASWASPVLFPRVWALYVDGKAVAAMRDRGAVEGVLDQVKRRSSGNAAALAFLKDVRVRAVAPASVVVTDPETAAERLEGSLGANTDRGVIYVDGQAVVALPDTIEANKVLERVKERAAAKVQELETAPLFKEEVEVRSERAVPDLWADGETAFGLLTGEGAEGEGSHTVKSGESGWLISRRAKIGLGDLQRLNPGVNLARLKTGQTLRVAKAGEPILTVVTVGILTEELPAPFRTLRQWHPKMFMGKGVEKVAGKPGLQRVTSRVTCENSKVVDREVLTRETIQPPRDQILAIGARRRPLGKRS